MSDLSSEISPNTSRQSCECYKKLLSYGIPLHISDENDLYSEHQKIITYENAFKLPGFLKINEAITEYPFIDDNELFHVFQQMAQVMPELSDFEENLLSFWILDISIEGLWTAQTAKMNFDHQKATLLWIAYFFNYIQKHNPTRKDLFSHLKKILFQYESNKLCEDCDEGSEEFGRKPMKSGHAQSDESSLTFRASESWHLPLPPNLDKSEKKFQNREPKLSYSEENNSATTDLEEEAKSTLSFDSYMENRKHKENTVETNLSHMKIILDILYRIFARLWVYLEIQTVFHMMPFVEQVDLPFALNIPKPLLKPEPPTPAKAEKAGKRQSFLEKSIDENEFERQLHKNDFILPLQVAEEAKLYMKQLFPQPASQRSVFERNKDEKIKK